VRPLRTDQNFSILRCHGHNHGRDVGQDPDAEIPGTVSVDVVRTRWGGQSLFPADQGVWERRMFPQLVRGHAREPSPRKKHANAFRKLLEQLQFPSHNRSQNDADRVLNTGTNLLVYFYVVVRDS